MTAVKGPFLFTADRWQDSFIDKAKQAGCGAVALQLGVAPVGTGQKVRAAGLQVIGWGTCSSSTTNQLNVMLPGVWMPQAENTWEFEELNLSLRSGSGRGLPIEPVMTSGGMEPPGNPTPEEKVAERARRRDLLRSFGVTKVWVEVYGQDADRSGQPNLGDVNHMCGFFKSAYGFKEAHPVIGLWTVDDSEPWAKNPYSVSRYNLSRNGRAFGAWRAEQMADERYAEIAAVPALPPPAGPPLPPMWPTTSQARREITDTSQAWE